MKRRLIRAGVIGLCALGIVLIATHKPGITSYQGKTIEAWALQLSSTNQAARNEAAKVFGALGTRALPELTRLLQKREPFWRRQLWRAAPRLPARLSSFIAQHVRPRDLYQVREAAARSLGLLGSAAEPAIPNLVAALRDEEGRVRWEAAEALGRIGGTTAVPALTNCLHDPDIPARQSAAFALGQIGPEAQEAVPALARALQDVGACSMAIYGLAQMGTSAVPVAIERCAKGDDKVRAAASRVLGGLLQHMAPPPYTAEPPVVSIDQSNAIAQMVATLTTALRDPVANVRTEAAQSLALSGVDISSAAPDLMASLKDGSPMVRQMSARALGEIGTAAIAALPELARLADDSDKSVSAAAKEAIKKIRRAAAAGNTFKR